MYIPNDNNVDYRLKKFVEYQRAVPPVHRSVLLKYAIDEKLTKDELIIVCWLMANTYHEITTLLLFEEYRRTSYWGLVEYYEKNSDKIQFGSAKKYIGMQNRFIPILTWFLDTYGVKPYTYLENFFNGLKNDKELKYEELIKFNQKCKNFGRFSADLFNEIYITYQKALLLEDHIEVNDEFDWEHCANLTSGVLNILYEDKLADSFDKGEISKEQLEELKPRLTEGLFSIKEEIEKTYNEPTDIPLFITKLCSFRNLFKNSRYGGYHHDRQLEYLKKYEKLIPEKKKLWSKIYSIREEVFSPNLLGEKNNWNGIRKERKKLWTTKGLTGVE